MKIPRDSDGPLATRGPTAEMNNLLNLTATDKTAKTGAGSSDGSRSADLVAPATRYRRSGRARFDLDIALCPLCRHGHHHRPFEGRERYVRHPACRPRAEYVVAVTRVVPADVEVGRREVA